jgi:3-deoxy-7-phosphoheptulonate synthase
MRNSWFKDSWKNFNLTQQPLWPSQIDLNNSIDTLEKLPSLVFSGETRNLKKRLKEVEVGNSFIIQAGNCAESFDDCHGPEIHNFLRIMNFMDEILKETFNLPILKIGRIAGQYGKPRSSDYEIINGQNLPVFRGENVNLINGNINDRTPNPNRLIEGYFRSVATLNLIRAFTQGNYSEENYRSDWFDFPYSENITESQLFIRYMEGIKEIKDVSFYNDKLSEIYISHEALLLDYETAFTRIDTIDGGYYNSSAHFLWIGDRTRHLNSSHLEYVRGIENPIGIKVGPNCNLIELIQIIKHINPENENGKVVLILRFGVDYLNQFFEALIYNVKKHDLNVIWMVDPMHGNTKTVNNRKVRYFDDILNETVNFFDICNSQNIFPGGIHLEMTSKLVTECIGGNLGVHYKELEFNYQSLVDPRLNGSQVIELLLEINKKHKIC